MGLTKQNLDMQFALTPQKKALIVRVEDLDAHNIVESTKKERRDSFERLKENHPIKISVSPGKTKDDETARFQKDQAMELVEKNNSHKKAKIQEEKSKLAKEVEKMEDAKSRLLSKVESASKKGKMTDFEYNY